MGKVDDAGAQNQLKAGRLLPALSIGLEGGACLVQWLDFGALGIQLVTGIKKAGIVRACTVS